jgi:hypothetical protein
MNLGGGVSATLFWGLNGRPWGASIGLTVGFGTNVMFGRSYTWLNGPFHQPLAQLARWAWDALVPSWIIQRLGHMLSDAWWGIQARLANSVH